MKKESLAATVILFNPSTDVITNIKTYIELVGKVYVFDNSLKRNQFIEDELQGVIYYNDTENRGISKRLNEAAVKAKEDGFSWLLTMDQDSSFQNGELEKYLNCIDNYREQGYVAMFGTEYDKMLVNKSSCSPLVVKKLITSGSVLNLDLFTVIGDFDEALFIDSVDHEYCFRALSKGFQIIKMSNIFLNHSLGDKAEYRSFKTFKKSERSLHSPIRLQYMVRNYFYIKEKYASLYKKEFNSIKHNLLHTVKNNLLYGEEKILILRSIYKGYIDFKKGKMGKIK